MAHGEAKFDHFSSSYEEEINRSLGVLGGKAEYFTRVKAAYLLELVASHFGATRKANLLDVGCGTGGTHPFISHALGSVTGTDISSDSLERAAQRNPANRYLHYDGKRLPFADASFDVVTAFGVMHHVPPAQWQNFSAEMRRVAKSGGLAVVFEHNPANPWTCRIVSNCDFDDDAVLLRQRELRGLFHDAGFGSVSSRSILSIPSFGKTTRAVDLFLGRLGLGAQYFVTATA